MNNTGTRKSMTGLSQNVNASQFDIDSNINMEGFKLFNLGLGVNSADSITKAQLDTATIGQFLKLDGTSVMELNKDVKLNAGDITGATDITCSNILTASSLVGTISTGTQNSITGLGGVTTLSMNSNKITSLSNGTAATDAINLSQLTASAALFLPLAGGTMDLNADITLNGGDITGAANITATTLTGTLQTAAQTNITSVGNLTALNINTQYSFPTSTSTAGFLLGINPADTSQLTFQNPAEVEDLIWKELTAGSAYETAVLRNSPQSNQAVSIGYDTAALPTADLVRLYVFDATNAVITRNQSATIKTDVISTTTFGQIKADNATGAGTSAPLFITGRGGVNIQHILPADGSTTTITSTTKSSFNTQVGMTIGAGLTAEPESSIVAQGTINNSNPTQKGVHLGEVGDFGVVQLCGSNGGTIEFTDQTESGTTTFNSRIFYDNTLGATNDLITWTNRPKNGTISYDWLKGCGNVVLNSFQGLNFFNPSTSPTTEYSIGREAGVWTSPFPSLYQSWGTGMKFVTNAAVGAQSTFKWYFDNTGTTPQVEISNGGKIASSFNPMIYASGVTTAAGTGFLRQRNTTSISLIATGQYTITLAITMPSTNYSVNINPEASAVSGFVFNKTATTFDVVTYISQSGSVATLSFSYSVIDFE